MSLLAIYVFQYAPSAGHPAILLISNPRHLLMNSTPGKATIDSSQKLDITRGRDHGFSWINAGLMSRRVRVILCLSRIGSWNGRAESLRLSRAKHIWQVVMGDEMEENALSLRWGLHPTLATADLCCSFLHSFPLESPSYLLLSGLVLW